MTGWRFGFLATLWDTLLAWLDWLRMLRPRVLGGEPSGPPPSRRRVPKPNGKPRQRLFSGKGSLREALRSRDRLESKAKEEAPSGGAPEPRYVNTWFEGEAPVLPLAVGRGYPFRLQIGSRRAKAGGSAVPFAEPDWGTRQDVRLLVTLYSQDFAIEGRHHTFSMPRRGASEVLTSHLTPLRAGRCRLRLIVSLAFELEVLQQLEVEAEAAEVPAAVPVTA